MTGTGRRARRLMAHGCYGGRELAAGAPREKGGRGEPHHGRRGAARGWSEADDEEQWRQRLKLDGDGVRVAEDGK
jgi:hypothetical protein